MKNYIIKGNSEYQDAQEWKADFLYGDRINPAAYHDPDNSCRSLYEDLTKFLSIQENKVNGLEGEFKYEFSSEPLGINVYEKNGSNPRLLFILRSDQLGFSAPSAAENHIYDFYLEKSENKRQAREKISKWIFDSRSIGGCFLWPMDRENGKWITNVNYNKIRGKGRMQDRADMCLQDIKNCFEEKDGSWLYKQYKEHGNMQKWLDHFGNGVDGFMRYVEFFCFKDFLNGNGMPKDLFDGGEIDFWDIKYVKKFSKYTVEELETVLKSLNKGILSRSEAIEKFLKITVPEVEGNHSGCKKFV